MLALLFGCASALDDATPYVHGARVLAVAAQPAEASATEAVAFTALYADEEGDIAEADLDWTFCTARRPLAELGPVASVCLDSSDESQEPIGVGVAVTGAIPDDTCSLFGPNPPVSEDGLSAGRPADPDATGGFYQPVLVFDGDQPTYAPVRTRCGLANVTQETYIEWNSTYVSNTAPTVSLDIPQASPGETVTLTASWPDCGEGACEGAETYVVYDTATKSFTTRREAISATWFLTSGEIGLARNGRSGDETEAWVENTWTAPTSGAAHLWVVLRDERGGVAFAGAEWP